MFRILRLTLALVGSLIVLVLTVRLIGNAQPSPLALLFTNADGTPCQQPCLLGVQPGKLSTEQAISLLKKHPLMRGVQADIVRTDSGVSTVLKANGQGVFAGGQLLIEFVAPDNEMVSYIELHLADPNNDALPAPWLPLAKRGDLAVLFMDSSLTAGNQLPYWPSFWSSLERNGIGFRIDVGTELPGTNMERSFNTALTAIIVWVMDHSPLYGNWQH
jgi:hypothetical protein